MLFHVKSYLCQVASYQDLEFTVITVTIVQFCFQYRTLCPRAKGFPRKHIFCRGPCCNCCEGRIRPEMLVRRHENHRQPEIVDGTECTGRDVLCNHCRRNPILLHFFSETCCCVDESVWKCASCTGSNKWSTIGTRDRALSIHRQFNSFQSQCIKRWRGEGKNYQ